MPLAPDVVPSGVAEPMLPTAFVASSVRRETSDTVTLDLEPASGDTFSYQPGQFTMVYVPGVGEVPISIAGGGPGEAALVHTVRAVGPVTEAICRVRPGDSVGIRGPYGTAWPIREAEGGDLLVVAGGIGLAPLRAVVRAVLASRERFGALSLVYGARSPSDLLYESELHTWRSRFDLEVEVTVDRSDPSWRGDVGLVTTLFDRVAFDPPETHAMVCGPEIMMNVVARRLRDSGVALDRVAISLERNMQCAIGFCGHCQFGPDFICKDGPVLPYAAVAARLGVDEL